MTLISFLRLTEFVTAIAAHAAILVFSFAAYRRTKLMPFALWIASSSIGILLLSAWYRYSFSPPVTHSEAMTFTVIYRIGFIIDNLLGAAGGVLLIQHLLAKFDSELPPKAEPDSK
jgi:hypothetical protein